MLSRFAQICYTPTKILTPGATVFFPHSKICPAIIKTAGICPGAGGIRGSGSARKVDIKRAEKSGPCRLGFIPEEWFQFLHSKTGVSGPYVLGIVLTNYLVSKEIFVMEHEYYLGLSITIVMYLVITRLGPGIGASLDKDVDDYEKELEKSRNDEVVANETIIKEGKAAQWRAEGQKELMDAKKENILMQLEAVYRERMMLVYNSVKGRMDYHVKRSRTETRIQQKWMVDWILKNVRQSITPDFQKEALASAIRDLAAAANKAK